MQKLSGLEPRDTIIESLKTHIAKLGVQPTMLIFQVGNRADSDAYIRQKKLFAEKIGAKVIHTQFPESVTQEELLEEIKKTNENESVHGILLQLPIPEHLSPHALIEAIDPKKDIDGLTSSTEFVPATARGVMNLCDFYHIEIKNKKITVIGKSALVGTPIAKAFKERGAKVTVCDRQNTDLVPFTKHADIIIVAAGQANLISEKHVSSGQVIIDVGINSLQGKLVGDVDFDAVSPIVKAISPVPGGVGPMTVAALFENLFEAASKSSF